MRKVTFAVGMILVLIGIGMISSSNLSYSTVMPIAIPGGTAENKNKLVCNFTGGEKLMFYYLTNPLWTDMEKYSSDTSWEISDYGNYPDLYVVVDISPINTEGQNSTFLIELIPKSYLGNPDAQGPDLTFWNVSILRNGAVNISSLIDTNGWVYTKWLGPIPFNGTYAINIDIYPHRDEPISFFGFYHNVTTVQYPNTYFLPVGGTVIIFGGLLSAVGVMTVNFRSERKKPARSNKH